MIIHPDKCPCCGAKIKLYEDSKGFKETCTKCTYKVIMFSVDKPPADSGAGEGGVDR